MSSDYAAFKQNLLRFPAQLTKKHIKSGNLNLLKKAKNTGLSRRDSSPRCPACSAADARREEKTDETSSASTSNAAAAREQAATRGEQANIPDHGVTPPRSTESTPSPSIPGAQGCLRCSRCGGPAGTDPFDGIVLSGMGGSGTPGSILQNIADCAIINVPILTWRDVGLPTHPFKNPLYIFVSFSGNTREPLDGLRKARKAGHQVAVVAGGGTLLDEAQKNGLPYTTFQAPVSLQPRQAYGYTLYATLTLLQSVFSSLNIPDLSARIDPLQFAKRADTIAARIAGKIVLVYTTHAGSHLGGLVKISITESAKALAFANTIPEVNHNELNLIETRPRNLSALFVTTQREWKLRSKEFELTRATLDEYGIPSDTITVPGKTALEETANAIAVAQWIGYHLSKRIGTNPLGLEVVNKIKDLAKKKGL